jgi:hypothetical protein
MDRRKRLEGDENRRPKLYCYLQGASLASLLGEADLIDGLLKELRINAHGRRSHLVSLEDKLDAVLEQLTHLSTAKALGFAGVSTRVPNGSIQPSFSVGGGT